jgi:hypothetical protein
MATPRRKLKVYAENTSNRTQWLYGEPVPLGGDTLLLETYDSEAAEREVEEMERSLSSIWRVSIY